MTAGRDDQSDGGKLAGNHHRDSEIGGAGDGEGTTASANQPAGNSYDWYRRGVQLLETGNPAAAVTLIEHAVRAEPESRSVREALARAQFDSGRYGDAAESFGWIVAEDPSDDYAQFGLGLASAKVGDLEGAARHLALAVAMRPDNRHYATALRSARARLKGSGCRR